MDLGGLERLFQRHRWQDGGQPAGQHGLASAWRADQQQIVRPGGRNLQRALGGCLAPNISEVHHVQRAFMHQRLEVEPHSPERVVAVEPAADIHQARSAPHFQSFRHRCLGQVGLGQHDPSTARSPGREGHGQGAPHRPQVSLEPHLTQHHDAFKAAAVDLAAGGKDTECYGEVER